jgi:hypothetical protein
MAKHLACTFKERGANPVQILGGVMVAALGGAGFYFGMLPI